MYLSEYEVVLDLNEFKRDYPNYERVSVVADVQIIQGDDPNPVTAKDWDLKMYDLVVYFIDKDGESDEVDLSKLRPDLMEYLVSNYADSVFEDLPHLFED